MAREEFIRASILIVAGGSQPEASVARYRLRFLLQEFDIPRGETLLGRSAECHVTIEDPLVSRNHARINLEGEEATISDLGSRNGVKVNGTPIKDAVTLKDGDRIRIGTQELVFCRVEMVSARARTTGFLKHCAKCHLPYAQEAGVCPNCGGTEQVDEDTLSGRFGSGGQGAWSVQLLIEVVERALAGERFEEAERMLRRAMALVEERAAMLESVDGRQLGTISEAALTIGDHNGTRDLAAWVLTIHRALMALPGPGTLTGIGRALAKHPDLAGELDGLAAALSSPEKTFSEDDAKVLAAIEALRAAGGTAPASGVSGDKTRTAIS